MPSKYHFQKPLSLAFLAIACIVVVTILISLQFPSMMSSPWIAMLFAASVTAVLGSTAIVTGGAIAALPLYALIMVHFEKLSARQGSRVKSSQIFLKNF